MERMAEQCNERPAIVFKKPPDVYKQKLATVSLWQLHYRVRDDSLRQASATRLAAGRQKSEIAAYRQLRYTPSLQC